MTNPQPTQDGTPIYTLPNWVSHDQYDLIMTTLQHVFQNKEKTSMANVKSSNRLNVLDNGYVILQDHMGTDLTPVNSARASFKKKSYTISTADKKLLKFLVENGHLSPFRHCMLQFEISAPLMVARQLWRYTVGAAQQETLDAWNEASYRYVSNDLEWYVPEVLAWRGVPDNMKQGSKGTVNATVGLQATNLLRDHIRTSLEQFEWALDNGIAPEQARLFLPANALYTTWYLTISLQALTHLLEERLDDHAMAETRNYAWALLHLTYPLFPESITQLCGKTLAL